MQQSKKLTHTVNNPMVLAKYRAGAQGGCNDFENHLVDSGTRSDCREVNLEL